MTSTTGPVTLREVTKDTLIDILRLKVADGQDRFVASNAVSIAEAYFCDKAWFRAIYAGETPVGFTMLYIDTGKPVYYLWRFMIDRRYQRCGFGRRALELIVDHVRSLPRAREITLSYAPGDGCPGPFYRKFGFVETGEIDDGECVMRLELPPA